MADEKLSAKFAKYCGEGKLTMVKKYIADKNVDVNWNMSSPLTKAVKYDKIEVVKLLLSDPRLQTDFENKKELRGSLMYNNPPLVLNNVIINPFTEAMFTKKYDILDLFLSDGRFTTNRTEYLDILLKIDDDELNNYFKKIPGFKEYAVSKVKENNDYVKIISKSVASIMMF
jgi:hypothetical protein